MGANAVHLCFVFAQILFYFRVWVSSEGIARFGLLMRVFISSSWDLIAISTHAQTLTRENQGIKTGELCAIYVSGGFGP